MRVIHIIRGCEPCSAFRVDDFQLGDDWAITSVSESEVVCKFTVEQIKVGDALPFTAREQAKPVFARRPKEHTPRGPGSELSMLLKRFGIDPTPTCLCRATALQMDTWGVEECSKPERINQIVGVMREEAAARGLPFADFAARLLIKRAIANASRHLAK